LVENENPREQDAGWVIITDGKKRLYCSHPMMRTEGFLRKLYYGAIEAKERILSRPSCRTCQSPMEIYERGHKKAYYWACPHHREETARWDNGLSCQSLKRARARRKKRLYYRKQRRENGQTVGKARLIRKTWQRTQLVDRT